MINIDPKARAAAYAKGEMNRLAPVLSALDMDATTALVPLLQPAIESAFVLGWSAAVEIMERRGGR